MKKIFALTAVSMMLAATTAFAACPLKSYQSSCNMPRISHAQTAYAPMPAIPMVMQNSGDPCCGSKKKGFFKKVFTPVRGVYDATLGQIFTGLY